MSGENGIAEAAQRWSGLAKIIGALIASAVFILGGGFFYNEVWNAPVLSYTVLPTYDLGSQAFSGIIVENRGRVALNEVQVIIDNLDSPVEALNMPGPHEPAEIEEGGEGKNSLRIVAERLSPDASLPIYLLTEGPVQLSADTLLVTSSEARGERNTRQGQNDTDFILLSAVVALIAAVALFLISQFLSRARTMEVQQVRVSAQHLKETIRAINERLDTESQRRIEEYRRREQKD